MRTVIRLKFAIFVGAVLIAIPAAGLMVALITQFAAYFQQGADPASIFHGNVLIVPAPDAARWLPSDTFEGTLPTTAQREEILAAYWGAWEALGRASLTGDTRDLPTYWAGGAIRQLRAGLEANVTRQEKHAGHQLRLTFFADDGSVVAFEDVSFSLEYTTTVSRNDSRNDSQRYTLTASASVIMTLDNGFWRIRLLSLRY